MAIRTVLLVWGTLITQNIVATGHHSNTTIAVFTYHTFGCCLIKYNLEEREKKNLNLGTHNMRNNECYTGDKTNDKITSMFSPYQCSVVAVLSLPE